MARGPLQFWKSGPTCSKGQALPIVDNPDARAPSHSESTTAICSLILRFALNTFWEATREAPYSKRAPCLVRNVNRHREGEQDAVDFLISVCVYKYVLVNV